ncbi:MAG: DUF507 family protein [Nitrospirae bacterium]|nr:DUF507 family protein [Nitrospirota bacterium]
MKIKKERITMLSKNIVEGLITKGCIVPSVTKDAIVSRLENIITEELMIEEKLNDEVREMLKTYSKQMEQGDVNYNRMFQMVKKKLIDERGIVL